MIEGPSLIFDVSALDPDVEDTKYFWIRVWCVGIFFCGRGLGEGIGEACGIGKTVDFVRFFFRLVECLMPYRG